MELQLKVESLCLFAWLLVSDSHYDAIPDAIDTNRMVSRFRSWYATWISVSDMKHGWIAICRWIARFFTRDWPSWSRSKMDQVMRRPIRENPKNKNKKDKGSGNEPIVSLPIEPSMTHTLSSILLSSSLFIHVLLSSIPPKHFSLFLGLLTHDGDGEVVPILYFIELLVAWSPFFLHVFGCWLPCLAAHVAAHLASCRFSFSIV